MNVRCWSVVLIGLGLSLSGCDAVKRVLKKESTEEAPAAASAVPPAPPANIEPAAQAPEIPTVEDFEEEAFKQVTSTNYEAELDRLEKDITKDTAPVKAAAQ